MYCTVSAIYQVIYLATKHIAYFKTPHKCGIMIAIRFRAIGENTYGNTYQGMESSIPSPLFKPRVAI